jgi:hypothetical protein
MPTSIAIKNTNQLHQLKLTPEIADVDPKTKKKTWKPQGIDGYLKSGEATQVWVGENQRIIIQELPT